MKIPEDQIEVKKVVGVSGSGNPVLYVVSKGGLHAFFTKQEGAIQSLGAAPHRAIALWLAEQKDPKIEWKEDFVKGEEFEDDLQKHEAGVTEQVRRVMFGPCLDNYTFKDDAYMVYSPDASAYTVLDRADLAKCINDGTVGRYDLVRHLSMTEPAFLAEDFRS